MSITAKIRPTLRIDFTDFGCINKVANHLMPEPIADVLNAGLKFPQTPIRLFGARRN
jgi:hypothetical protein